MILRQTTGATEWEGGQMPRGTGVLILAPLFCRGDERLPFADRFTPELWLSAGEAKRRGVVPFSIGPAACPGRNLVLLFASHFLVISWGKAGCIQPRPRGLIPLGRCRRRSTICGYVSDRIRQRTLPGTAAPAAWGSIMDERLGRPPLIDA
jgi:hypothetical protein